MKSDEKFYYFTDDSVKGNSSVLYNAMETRQIKKIYYRNIYKLFLF